MLVDPPYRGLGPTLISAVCVALLGSVLLAVAETISAVWVATQRLGELPPADLVLAAFGRTGLTHLLLWYPLLVVLGCVVWALGRRPGRGFRRSQFSAARVLTPSFLVAVSLLVVPSALGLIGIDSRIGLFVARIALLGLAVLVWPAAPWLRARLPVWNPVRWRNLSLMVALGSLLLGVVALFRSPFFDPGGFQVRAREAQESTAGSPNVVWIVLDTVRADRMGLYGYDRLTTPFVDHLASDSVVFDRVDSNAIWTVPSHASMFTGKSLREHGTDYDNLRLDDRFETVAEVLSGRGYETVSFSNNAWVSPGTNLVQGFERSEIVGHLRQLPRMSLDVLLESFGITPPFSWLDTDSGAALTNDLVGDWLEERDSSRPFLLFINYMEAHLPYVVPIQARAVFLRDAEIHRSFDLRLSVYGHLPTVMGRYFDIQGPDVVEASDRRILRRQYDAALRYLDRRTEEVIGLVEQRGVLDDTLVIVTSDHGEYLGQHDLWSHMFFPHRAVTGVPLVLRPPGSRVGRRVSEPVQLSDLHATILALVGAQQADSKAGRDLLALDPAAPRRLSTVAEFGGPSRRVRSLIEEVDSPESRRLLERQRAINDGPLRLIQGEAGTTKLFDVFEDPAEANDLSAVRPEDVARLQELLQAWLDAVPAWQASPGSETNVESMLESERRVLRALGYLN